MLFRRKLISNFIWIIAMIAIIVMGAQYAFLYGIDFLFAGEDSYLAQLTSISATALDIGLLSWILLYVGLCVGVYFIGRAISSLIAGRFDERSSTPGIIKIILACLALVGAVVHRGFLLVLSGSAALTDSKFFDAAAGLYAGESGIGDLSVHGASYVYITILGFIMQFLGDQIIAVVLLQTLIQILTIILAFFVFGRMVNYWTGLTAAIVLTVSPLYTSKIHSSSPGSFVAFLLLFAFFLTDCLLRIRNKAFKIAFGVICGIITGYLIYLDAANVLALIAWFFVFMYDLGLEKKGFKVTAYMMVPVGVLVGAFLSIALDGGFDPNGISIAAQTWLKVTSTTALPEYSLVDPALGVSCLMQCLIMVGVSSMTIMGTAGRDYIEYEFPWVMMILCALTPMTRIGYLHDNTISLIMYTALTGAGVSAMFKAKPEAEEEEDEEEDDGDSDGEEETAEETDLFNSVKNSYAQAEAAGEPDGKRSAEAPAAKERETADKAKTGKEAEPAAPEEPQEELPTSIPWAEIKKYDEGMPDLLDDDYDEKGHNSPTVLTSADKDYNVVIEGSGFVEEEVYIPEDDEDDEDTAKTPDTEDAADKANPVEAVAAPKDDRDDYPDEEAGGTPSAKSDDDWDDYPDEEAGGVSSARSDEDDWDYFPDEEAGGTTSAKSDDDDWDDYDDGPRDTAPAEEQPEAASGPVSAAAEAASGPVSAAAEAAPEDDDWDDFPDEEAKGTPSAKSDDDDWDDYDDEPRDTAPDEEQPEAASGPVSAAAEAAPGPVSAATEAASEDDDDWDDYGDDSVGAEDDGWDDDTDFEDSDFSLEDAEDISLIQVDDLPGMIPNPLPLPPKKPHKEMDFDI